MTITLSTPLNLLNFPLDKKDNSVDKLNTNDFVSLSNLLEEFIIDFDAIAEKKLSTLRSWLQTQGNKFLIRFHLERKDRLT